MKDFNTGNIIIQLIFNYILFNCKRIFRGNIIMMIIVSENEVKNARTLREQFSNTNDNAHKMIDKAIILDLLCRGEADELNLDRIREVTKEISRLAGEIRSQSYQIDNALSRISHDEKLQSTWMVISGYESCGEWDYNVDHYETTGQMKDAIVELRTTENPNLEEGEVGDREPDDITVLEVKRTLSEEEALEL
jgi:hypothetical protein